MLKQRIALIVMAHPMLSRVHRNGWTGQAMVLPGAISFRNGFHHISYISSTQPISILWLSKPHGIRGSTNLCPSVEVSRWMMSQSCKTSRAWQMVSGLAAGRIAWSEVALPSAAIAKGWPRILFIPVPHFPSFPFKSGIMIPARKKTWGWVEDSPSG